ncbi:putative bifunctional diguanylate cyclase/phosphodiesterase [Rubellimicrobium arenae]|uniref:putative bifunctional diguanylate cyclase/phosphodiesterase n=1 Tax=Rubellimicrobium arenae TaxID=2817372 RepID=UPI001B312723|nr:bifunctional diguanylate cyclase/phosphodiesterase [Rubellimicrobium arenae]
MKSLLRIASWPVEIGVIAGTLLAFRLAVHFEMLEQIYAFSRAHEEWELDEYFTLLLALSMSLPLLLWWWNRQLSRANRLASAAEAEARRLSLLDPLTRLPNRRGFYRAVEEVTSGSNPALTVLLLDLDRFKPVNDLRGHEAGDQLLRAVARRLRRSCPEDAIVARLGGDEFVVALSRPGLDDCGDAIGRTILRAMQEPFVFDDWQASISCSIGIADWQRGLSGSDLLRRADQAMYRAKQAGRDGLAHFDPPLGEALREQAALEHDLRRALTAGEILPYFQPIFDITGRQLRAFEVLARWCDPQRGFVPPDRFIPLAEELGLIERLSEIVLEKACAALEGWPTDLPISFNLSPRQLGDPMLPYRILAILERHGIPGSRLEIEITERAVLADMEVARRIVAELVKAGVRISLDDFGTGTSSLAILTQLPIDRIKIDRSFIAEVDRLPERAKIVAGVLALASSLGLDVTAEGIERDEELAFLRERRCALGQGFLLGRPQPAEDVARLISDHEEPARAVG